MSSQELHEVCTSRGEADKAACDAFIAAVADVLVDARMRPSGDGERLCVPEGIELEGMVDGLVPRLEGLADRGRAPAAGVVAALIAARYRCGRGCASPPD